MELKITPEDLVPGYRSLRNEAKERGDAASRNGDGYGAVYWGGIEEALAEFGDACDRLNARLATLTPEALAQEGGR